MQVRLGVVLFAMILCTPIYGQSTRQGNYQYTIDLTNVVDDKVFVELTAPSIASKEITFYFPQMIPGTYAIQDYGRFVSDFKAVDSKGKKLKFKKLDTNSWRIMGANKLARISYWIEDSFDTNLEGPDIFWPAGTNIEAGKNFIINSSGFFGYFQGMKGTPFRLNVIRDKKMYGATGLIPARVGQPTSTINLEKENNNPERLVDVYETTTYDNLVDSPIMYAAPDTAVIKVGNAEVLIASYAPNNKINAREIAESIREVLLAQEHFLGGTLPVDKYAFLFYFTPKITYMTGALEHSYSSMYFMQEMGIEDMNQQLKDFAAHEFFHIITPLTIHSEQIGDFDFNHPEMSRHLWLYEGVTEYFAGLVQVKYGLISPEEYMDMLREKLLTSDQFIDTVALTELSEKGLGEYEDQNYNFYMKGAMVGLCLDIKLRNLSNGKYGMQNLMADLSKKFGKSKSFKDNELFDEMAALTYPEIGEFLKKYVGGPEPLPYKEVFDLVGIDYTPDLEQVVMSLGITPQALDVEDYNDKPMLKIKNPYLVDEQGLGLGFETGDILLKVNGEFFPDLGPQLQSFIERHSNSLVEGDTLTYTVLRKGTDGKMAETQLSAEIHPILYSHRHILSFKEGATPEQIETLRSWLLPN